MEGAWNRVLKGEASPREAAAFATAWSAYYPDLEAVYAERAQAWLVERDYERMDPDADDAVRH